MSKRVALLGLGALMLALNSGCCLSNCINCWHDRWLAHYQATHFCGCGCGETFYNHWVNNPPQCCDPCDQWGNFTGGRKWWVSNCQGCRGGGCGDCGPGGCPGVSPAGRNYNPGPGGNPGPSGMFPDDGIPMNPESVAPPAEEVPAPYQQSTRGNMRGYQSAPMQNGPSRMGRQPRYNRPPDPRLGRRQPRRTEADIMPVEYQATAPFYDDEQVAEGGGNRATTTGSSTSANYRR